MKIDTTTKFLVLLALVSFFLSFILYTTHNFQGNIAPKDSGAIFGGKPEQGYASAGYMISFGEEETSLCGNVFISGDVGISASHCIKNKYDAMIGIGEYDSSPFGKYTVTELEYNPAWDGETAQNDIGFFRISQQVPTANIAVVAEPTTGCGYSIVGYGQYENQDATNGDLPIRKSYEVCIETDYGTYFTFKGKEGGVCFGDSGSPIFRTDTNQVVGILSLITKPTVGSNICYVTNKGVAVKASSFMNDLQAFKNGKPGKSACTGATCTIAQGGFCASGSNFNCSSPNICIQNKCIQRNSTDLGTITAVNSIRSALADFNLSDFASSVVGENLYVAPLSVGILSMLAAILRTLASLLFGK